MTIFVLLLVFFLATPAGAAKCIMQSPIAGFEDVLITDYFRAPACERCSGNRGIELQLQSGQSILAVTDGVISFVGKVNNTKYLVLLTENKLRITYGKIASSTVRVGDRVEAGQQVAISGTNLYFGIREYSSGVEQYLDPMKFLASAPTSSRKAVLVSDEARFAVERNSLKSQCRI